MNFPCSVAYFHNSFTTVVVVVIVKNYKQIFCIIFFCAYKPQLDNKKHYIYMHVLYYIVYDLELEVTEINKTSYKM